MVHKFMQVLQATSRGVLVLGTLCMLGMGATTVLNVILRFFNIAMAGFMESIELMMIVAVCGAMAFAVFEKSQVAVDVLVTRLSSSNQKKFQTVGLIANFIFWALIGYATFDWILYKGAYAEMTDVLKVPIWPFQLLWFLGLLFFSIVYLMELLLPKSEGRTRQ